MKKMGQVTIYCSLSSQMFLWICLCLHSIDRHKCCFPLKSETKLFGLKTEVLRLPYTNIPLTHVQQKYNWDCGISCVLMVLSEEKRKDLFKNFAEVCAEEGFNKRYSLL